MFLPGDKMSLLITRHHTLLLMMSRFGLPLGFGDKTISEVCKENHVHTSTFLIVANYLMGQGEGATIPWEQLSLPSLMQYLKNAHSYFLDFQLPAIRKGLTEALDNVEQHDVSLLILRFFDEYTAEVRRHMDYEDRYVFSYVKSLLEGTPQEGNYNITLFAQRHNHIEPKFTELKNIIIKYYPGRAYDHRMNTVLLSIFMCEDDLASHSRVEDWIFVPAVRRLEEERGKG